MTAGDRACAVQLLRSAAADHLTHLDPGERDELVERITGALDRCAAKAWDDGFTAGLATPARRRTHQPVPGGGVMDEDREALAEVLKRRLDDDCPDYWPDLNSWAADLMPVVDAIARRRAAEELRAAASEAKCAHPDVGWFVPTYALNDRADALDAK